MKNGTNKKTGRLQIYITQEKRNELKFEADKIGLSLNDYATILLNPCQVCGNDKVHIELLKKDIRKTSNGHGVHLMIYHESTINSQTELTTLKLKYVLSGMLQVDSSSLIYTPKGTHKFTEGKTNATLAVFKNNIRTTTINCIIKNNEIYSHESK